MKTRDVVVYGVYLAIFLFMGLVPNIGIFKVGTFEISLMAFPVIIMTMHVGWRGAIFGSIMMGTVLMINGVIYGAPLIALVGMGDAIIITIGARVIMGMLLALIKISINKLNVYIQCILITISTLLLNHILFLGMVALFSEKYTLIIIFTLAGLNIAIEWPVVLVISLACIPLIEYLKTHNTAEDRY